jgi:hypothetical protein
MFACLQARMSSPTTLQSYSDDLNDKKTMHEKLFFSAVGYFYFFTVNVTLACEKFIKKENKFDEAFEYCRLVFVFILDWFE